MDSSADAGWSGQSPGPAQPDLATRLRLRREIEELRTSFRMAVERLRKD